MRDKGTHSERKGGLSHLLTGTPDLAPLVPTCIRARWAAEALQVIMKYAKHSDAGDALIARMLSLLDPQTPQFTTLGPHFSASCEKKEIDTLVSRLLGSVQTRELQKVAPWLVASLVYHWAWLKETLPKDHAIWQSSYGALDENEIARWQGMITLENDIDVHIQGIPVSTLLLQQNAQMMELLKKIKDCLDGSSTQLDTLAKIIPLSAAGLTLQAHKTEFEEFAKALGERMEVTIKTTLMETGCSSIEHRRAIATDQQNQREITRHNGYRLYHWREKYRAIPQDLVWPSSKAALGWESWWGLSGTSMPLRTVIKGEYRVDLLDQCTDPKARKKRTTDLFHFEKVMDYLEENGKGSELTTLIESVQTSGTDFLVLRDLATKVWDKAWKAIKEAQGTEWHKQRKHDAEKASVRTVFRHIPDAWVKSQKQKRQ